MGENRNQKPTISIYQNSEHVAEVLQQIFGQPLITDEAREGSTQDSQSKDRTGEARTDFDGSFNAPFFGSVGTKLALKGITKNANSLVSNDRVTRNYIYSQAYYLAIVRSALQEQGSIKNIHSLADTENLAPGDFVEFEAEFQPNQITALLDILTPELISAIVFHSVRRSGIKLFEGWDTFEEVQKFSFENQEKAQVDADLARAIAEAIRTDFRTTHTREFYGTIGDGVDKVTAITICENAYFSVEDEDRLLDGRFKVLGKVTSLPQEDLPVLDRNKILNRIHAEAVDDAFDWLKESASELPIGKKINEFGDDESEWREEDSEPTDSLIDMAIESRINGISFKVIPIAIYV